MGASTVDAISQHIPGSLAPGELVLVTEGLRTEGRHRRPVWFTFWVTGPGQPTDPASLEAALAGMSKDELMNLAQQLASGGMARRLGLLAEPEQGNQPIVLGPAPSTPVRMTLKIELRGTRPRIWRRLSLPGDLSLDRVHTMFQAAMGWTDSHLHRFQPGTMLNYRAPHFLTDADQAEGESGTPEAEVRLDQVLRDSGDKMVYLYDFGDSWEHLVTLESLAPLTNDDRESRCLAGARACPPEDVGGIDGHSELAAWLRAGAPEGSVPEPFENADDAHSWLPQGYDPDAFDPAAATAAMKLWATGGHLPWHGLPEPLTDLITRLRSPAWAIVAQWLADLGPRAPVELGPELVDQASRPWLSVLNAIGPGVKLTAAGYLPPAVVTAMAESSGVTDWWIGKVNREDLTWPVSALRATTTQLRLLRKSKGTLSPTARARAVAGNPRALVCEVLDRLPLGDRFEKEAGWLALLGLAAGRTGAELDTQLAEVLTGRGWRIQTTSPINATAARQGHQPTTEVLAWMVAGMTLTPDPDPQLLTELARATLLGVAPPEQP